MSKNFHNQAIFRVIDANLNRAKEGLRVCEEIVRFILDNRQLTAFLKELRHKLENSSAKIYPAGRLIAQRQSGIDVGRKNNKGEFNRRNFKDIFAANIQRVKESLRVLEEFTKLISVQGSLNFKELRYEVYEAEKRVITKISALPDFKQAAKRRPFTKKDLP